MAYLTHHYEIDISSDDRGYLFSIYRFVSRYADDILLKKCVLKEDGIFETRDDAIDAAYKWLDNNKEK